MPSRRTDIWIGAGILAFCAFAGWRTLRIPAVATGTSAGPNFVPWLMIGGIVVLTLALMLRSAVAQRSAVPQDLAAATTPSDPNDAAGGAPSGTTLRRMAVFALLLVAYAAFFMPVGYLATTAVVFVAGMALLGERNWIRLIVLPLIITAAVYWGFTRYLGVWLP
ncbi:tripartite tricarboxylate transporter TctB family protein [Jiella sonneratiae]|uniref:Tripartite tricarboxylate transporter TctB family protein n=1 Tax=Jiella sonneratiae TaxID=2816856 RepID=A0ABS3JAT6_9HYPH|nr:tripartite tricarboxylate transporter TctB family protein [Jiella sonneratiae]